MRLHVGDADHSAGKKSKGSWPSKFSIQKVNCSLLNGLLVNSLLTFIVSLKIVPLLVDDSIIMGQKISILAWQHELLHEARGETKQSLLIGSFRNLYRQLFEGVLKCHWVRFGGSDVDISSDDFSNKGEIDDISKNIENRPLEQCLPQSRAQKCDKAYVI
jgi:hypothetical protein